MNNARQILLDRFISPATKHDWSHPSNAHSPLYSAKAYDDGDVALPSNRFAKLENACCELGDVLPRAACTIAKMGTAVSASSLTTVVAICVRVPSLLENACAAVINAAIAIASSLIDQAGMPSSPVSCGWSVALPWRGTECAPHTRQRSWR